MNGGREVFILISLRPHTAQTLEGYHLHKQLLQDHTEKYEGLTVIGHLQILKNLTEVEDLSLVMCTHSLNKFSLNTISE